MVYFVGFQTNIVPLNQILDIIQIIFMVIELVFGFVAMRNFVRANAIKYSSLFNKDGTLIMDDDSDEEQKTE